MRMVMTLLSFFIIAQILGIYTGVFVLLDLTHNPFVSDLIVTSDTEEPINALFFIVYIILAAAAMVLLIRYLGLYLIIFRIMEFGLIASASSIVFYAFMRIFLGYELSTIIAIFAGLVFSGIKVFRPQLKNAAAIIATAGVGVVFGISLGIIPLIIFLMMLAVYDYLSVFATKHMVEMATYIVKKDLAFTITAKEKPKMLGERERRIDLGTGDIIAPIMLEVSALTINPIASLFVFVGAIISMAIFLTLVFKKGMVLPALPPIVLGMIASLLFGLLIGAY